MANRFVSVIENAGHLFNLGWKKAIAFESKPEVQKAEMDVADDVSLISPAIGTTLHDIFGIFIRIEQVATAVDASTGTGPKKLQVALPEFEAVILNDPLFKGKNIPDLAKYNDAIIQSADAFVKLLNAFESANPVAAPTVPPVTVPTPVQAQPQKVA